MEMVEVVVKIPKDEYGYMIANPLRYNVCDDEKLLYNYIKNGTVLPKGHGRLIDADEVSKGKFHFECECDCAVCSHSRNCECDLINSIPTVIEADKDGQDGR